jgi:hypothetical protein
MDDLEGRRNMKPEERVGQFERLRKAIEERAAHKYFEEQAQAAARWCCDLMISR